MGVHTGAPVVLDGDYVGLDVHRVARICSAAHGGQVLVSESTRDTAAPGGHRAFHDLGHHRLKDLDRPERLYQLVAAGLAEDFPAPPGRRSATTSAPSSSGRSSRPAPPSAGTCSPPPPTTSPGAGP